MEDRDTSPFTAAVAFRTPTDGGVFTLRATSFEELAESLTSRLTLSAILANAGSLTMLHACGVADPETGAVVALVAKSGTGKTTASSVLARQYGYVTDETVAIRPDESVIPYPKPLSVKQAPGLPKQQVGPDALGLLEAPARLHLRSIVLLDRVESSEPVAPVLSRVPLADAVLALIPDSSSQAAIVQPLQSLCRLIDAAGGVWQVTYSEARDLPAALEPLFQASPAPEPEWRPVAQENAPDGGIPEGKVRRAACTDAVTIGDDLLLVLEGAVVRLGGIGPALWAAASKPASLNELTQAVRDVHGAPQGHQAAVVRAVEQLTAAGILQRSGN
ncbi:ATP-binding protein [Arthrobacter sp. BHU FT2]|nr:ATP-binding protein [Arthrobacter sp. BHU FT2]